MAKKLRTDESGQALTEYGLIIAVVALVVVAAIIAFRNRLSGVFNAAANELNAVTPTTTQN